MNGITPEQLQMAMAEAQAKGDQQAMAALMQIAQSMGMPVGGGQPGQAMPGPGATPAAQPMQNAALMQALQGR